MKLAAGNLRQELEQALGLGELLVLAAIAVLAPLLRLEDAYVPVTSFQPHDVVGEGYFLWLVAILGLLVAARTAVAGRFRLPEPAPIFSIRRVSTLRPWKENSFHTFVPTGNVQTSGSEASMDVSGGRKIQRRFEAPSDQSGYWGAYCMFRESIVFAE
jgi:hypothetical protein